MYLCTCNCITPLEDVKNCLRFASSRHFMGVLSAIVSWGRRYELLQKLVDTNICFMAKQYIYIDCNTCIMIGVIVFFQTIHILWSYIYLSPIYTMRFGHIRFTCINCKVCITTLHVHSLHTMCCIE